MLARTCPLDVLRLRMLMMWSDQGMDNDTPMHLSKPKDFALIPPNTQKTKMLGNYILFVYLSVVHHNLRTERKHRQWTPTWTSPQSPHQRWKEFMFSLCILGVGHTSNGSGRETRCPFQCTFVVSYDFCHHGTDTQIVQMLMIKCWCLEVGKSVLPIISLTMVKTRFKTNGPKTCINIWSMHVACFCFRGWPNSMSNIVHGAGAQALAPTNQLQPTMSNG